MNKKMLSCDWGTSSFRLRLIDIPSGNILNESFASQGTASTYIKWKEAAKPEQERVAFYLDTIKVHSNKLLADAGIVAEGIPVVISGMASSSIGMLELPYTKMPFAATGNDLQIKEIKKTASFPHDSILVSGATTGADVMRGEETQLIGCLNGNTKDRQLFIFPGTHSKHILTAGGKALAMETFMTGEFFELLTKKSILSDSVTAGGDIGSNENNNAFAEGVQESMKQSLLHSSFIVRTNQLFRKYSKTANYFFLSGLLIGTELSQLSAREANRISIVGDKKLQVNYKLALSLLQTDKQVDLIDDAAATIKGQMIIYKRVYGL